MAVTSGIKSSFSKGWQDFKGFAFKGNMIDLAVAVVIGTAFGKVIDGLVAFIFMPLIGYVTPHTTYENWQLGTLKIGFFIGVLVNFLIVAFAIFLFVVKLMGTIMKKAAPPPVASAPTTRECPMCLSLIPIKARKCSHCTSDVPVVETTAATA